MRRLVPNNQERCADTCSEHLAVVRAIDKLETEQDKSRDKHDEVIKELSIIRVELREAKTRLQVLLLLSMPVYTAVVGAVVYALTRGG
jgi:hypothetical protein